MLTYCYALIMDPCEHNVDALLDYARAHPGCLLTLPPYGFTRHVPRHRDRLG
jgi:hypothetical protein